MLPSAEQGVFMTFMKKLLVLIAMFFSLTACGPNSTNPSNVKMLEVSDLDGTWHPIDPNAQVDWPTKGPVQSLTFLDGILTVTDTVNNGACVRVRRIEMINRGNNVVAGRIHTTCDVSSVCTAAGGMGCNADFITDQTAEEASQDFAFLGTDLYYVNRQLPHSPIVFRK